MRKFFFIATVLVWGGAHAQEPRIVLPSMHHSSIDDLAFSPDGKYLLSASYDGTAKLWDIRTGILLADITSHSRDITSVDFSFDGKYFLTASRDATIKIWKVPEIELVAEFKEEILGFNNAAFSPDGKQVVAAIGDGEVTVWDIQKKKLLWRIGNSGASTSSAFFAAFSSDGKMIYANTRDSTIGIWSAETGALIRKLEKKPSNDLNYARISPDGKFILRWGLRYYGADITEIATGKVTASLRGIYKAAFSKDGTTVVTDGDRVIGWDPVSGEKKYEIPGSAVVFTEGSDQLLIKSNGTISTFGINTGNFISTVPLSLSEVNGYKRIWLSDKANKIAIVGRDYSISIFSILNGSMVSKMAGHLMKVNGTTLSRKNGEMIICDNSNYQKIWDPGQLTFRSLTFNESMLFSSPTYSTDSKIFITSALDSNKVYVWDALTGKEIGYFPGYYGYAYLSPNGKVLATFDNLKRDVLFWDLNTFELLSRHSLGYDRIDYLTFSSQGNLAALTGSDTAISVFNYVTGKLSYTLKEPDGREGIFVEFSPDGKEMITMCSYRNVAKIWEAATGKFIRKILDGDHTPFMGASFSADGKKLISFTYKQPLVRLWNYKTGLLISDLSDHNDPVYFGEFFPDGKTVVTADDITFRLWDAETGKALKQYFYDRGQISGVCFNNETVLFKDNAELKVYNIRSGQQLYSLLCIDSLDYICITKAGYYKSTTGASKLLHYVTKDLKVITFEQLDVKYNRPDKVLEAIGNTDTTLIKSYRKAWEKRIKKLGIDTTSFRDGYSVPEADFTNRDAIEYEQKTGTLKLLIRGNDITYKLDRFNVWINETPIFGQRGINIRKRNKNDFDTTITIKLSQGENRIETSITNVNGTESYRMPLTVNYTPAIKQKESVRFIGIGIDQFADNKYNLQYSAKDIRDLSKKLKNKYKTDIIIDTLFNENVTVSNVKALKQKLQTTTENDKVIVAYSGHGMLSKEYDYYLSTYSVNFDKPEENGLPYDELENLLDSIPARKKLMLIDACHSGEVDKEDLVTLNASSDSLIKGLKPVAYKKEGHLGLKNSFELMQSLFVNVGKSTGATVISAAAGTQFALERNDLKNGVFTYSILEAMNKYPTLKISELKNIVSTRVEELTKGLQKPTSRNETIAVDWTIW
ncbi:MAG: caspase family protein [Chitinophagaceae bacterium]|nr:caspase family protein [Chitinophagaceae bacterium]